MREFDKLLKQYGYSILTEADGQEGQPQEQAADPNSAPQEADPSAQQAPQEPEQAPQAEPLAPESEVLLIRDLLKALVITIPPEADIDELINTGIKDGATKKEAAAVRESIQSVINQYANYEDNYKKIASVDNIVINESNRFEVYKRILQVMKRYI